MTDGSKHYKLRLRVHGRVQGVGFRWFVLDNARRLGLAGFVRNVRDGGVDLEAEGPEEALIHLEAMCRIGPPGASVGRVERLEMSSISGAPDAARGTFEIR